MYNKKKEIKMTKVINQEVKKLRIKILDNMKSCQVKPLKVMFPNHSVEEYNKIPSTAGYNVIWTKNKMSYNFASVSIDGVINQVLKLEGVQ